MKKSLDDKLAAIHADPHGCREFILADAKDADMAFGVTAPGRVVASGRWATLAEYRENIRSVIQQELVDIVLMSVSTSEQLCLNERLFDDSPVTPAIRANDATDVFAMRGSQIPSQAAAPFRTALLDHAQCGHLDCSPSDRLLGANLGLYSVTFNNDRDRDLVTLQAYQQFRQEAERKGFRHFLEVFHPNVPDAVPAEQIPAFVNDCIARALAGVGNAARPVFLKIPYPGPSALEELVAYDPHLIVGILGGSAGTTHDAFQLLAEAQKHGARAALFGRKINQAECQLAFIELLRHITQGDISPRDAVHAYHAVLQKLNITPRRSLEEDLQLTEPVLTQSAGSSGSAYSSEPRASQTRARPPVTAPVDFSKMTSEERLAYHLARIRGIGGDETR